ncbi:M18 family aminopeptidase [Acutalibacter sp. LFL-21]|uniref:M18 family aminopeptidase n=1 Tax=Acutalibacter sp. LFL-21 TaxID=2983399 RepID=UPI0021D68A91|nr:M18 family aminopeptidase [Acutalibacter sp. LFL-21]MCU7652607.1 M18 family aminopeptidase [Acutalibacter sp. LFL-21]
MIHQLFDFIQCSPTASHTAATVRAMLVQASFTQLLESQPWDLQPGGRYYTTRGMSSLIAFQVPKADFHGFSVIAPHGDSPCFKVKESPELRVDGQYTKLNTEVYGGMQLALWTDRPLSVAGRLAVRTENGVKGVLCDIRRDLLLIPGVAIHMNRGVNEGVKLDLQKDTLPLLGGSQAELKKLVAENAGVAPEDILSWDLYLYSRAQGTVFGAEKEFIAAPRLDDLECVFAAAKAFLAGENRENVTVLSLFDNEETGSLTRQGADSPFLSEVLERISLSCGKSREEHLRAIASGFMLSADNAHAVHPDSPEKSDPTNRCYLNGGVVVKHSPRYASDALTAGLFQRICQKAGVPVQVYYNNSKIPGGGTLGNLSGSHVALPTVDIGLAQLSMHSPYETAGAKDLDYMVWAMQAFYESVITQTGREEYAIQ